MSPAQLLSLLLLSSLATWQAVEVARHSELGPLVRLREWATARWLPWPLSAIGCPWCLSVLVGAVAAGLGLLAMSLPPPYCYVAIFPLVALSASRLANLYNDVAYRWTRTPRGDRVQQVLQSSTDEQVEAEYHRRELGRQDGPPK